MSDRDVRLTWLDRRAGLGGRCTAPASAAHAVRARLGREPAQALTPWGRLACTPLAAQFRSASSVRQPRSETGHEVAAQQQLRQARVC